MADSCDCPPKAGAATCEARRPPGPACPTCHRPGKSVGTDTVRALVAVSLMEVDGKDYFFCRTPDCPTVYFAADTHQEFTEASLRELVHQKHPGDPDVFVCYCFRHTPASISRQFLETGAVRVIEEITAGIQAAKCACDIRNPQGSCCLGNVRSVLGRITAERAASS